ncbi:hypothetical protein [Falsiroseomonas sp. HW251]|uniref:hypothetical protein n=1 Tax=Falsiroseomonas sp. HW251 TaxID=3390998 RepID=UPI003D313818
MRRLAVLLLLAGCAVRDPAPPEDETLARLAGSANRALELDEPGSAATLYRRALDRARERDDAGAIADMAFGEATARLAQGDAAAAERIAREVREELARRNRAASPRLVLVEATALLRLGRDGQAEALASQVVRRGAEDPAAAKRAWFLLGLVAARRGDVAGVQRAEVALHDAGDPAFQADAVELAAHVALLRGDAQRGADDAAAAALLRQQALDYRGLSRALALEGAARAALGDAALAADLYRRAALGAARRGERDDARRWEAEAGRLAPGAQPRSSSQARSAARASPGSARSR